jgi:transcriptional regulator with XRE-family HTH domain
MLPNSDVDGRPKKTNDGVIVEGIDSAEVMVGKKIRELRSKQGYSLRELAQRSGLNINTLSMIENWKISPSVSTLQQLARGLNVSITNFFESEPVASHVVFTSSQNRTGAVFNNTRLENLGKDLAGNTVQPFVVTLEVGADSGDRMIVHTGHEFVYCLSGQVNYEIEENNYLLLPGDSVVFESHLPHRWKNVDAGESKIILVLYPTDQNEEPGGRHFQMNEESK